MKTGYPVPAAPVEVELRFRNSRFIGAAGFAETVEAARQYIQAHRERFPDARHHVYAFAVGFGASVTCGMSDDGEPSGTAGRPVLTVVQGSGLGDTVVVVTRYFGGTKLGTGGLVKAYTETTQAAIALIERRDKVHTVTFTCRCLTRCIGPAGNCSMSAAWKSRMSCSAPAWRWQSVWRSSGSRKWVSVCAMPVPVN